jgi:hypothetical protein
MLSKKRFLPIFLCLLTMVTGCAGKPSAESFFHPLSLEQRQLQTRIFKTGDEIKVLAACAALLQDNGFQVAEAESRLGLLVSSKLIRTKSGVTQAVSANVVTRPESVDTVAVRVIFRHSVTGSFHGDRGPVLVRDSAIYQEFFSRLSKALFLEAQPL